MVSLGSFLGAFFSSGCHSFTSVFCAFPETAEEVANDSLIEGFAKHACDELLEALAVGVIDSDFDCDCHHPVIWKGELAILYARVLYNDVFRLSEAKELRKLLLDIDDCRVVQAAEAVKYVHLANWSRGCLRGCGFCRGFCANVLRASFLHLSVYCFLDFRWDRATLSARVFLCRSLACLLEVVLDLGFRDLVTLLDKLLDLLEVVAIESVFFR